MTLFRRGQSADLLSSAKIIGKLFLLSRVSTSLRTVDSIIGQWIAELQDGVGSVKTTFLAPRRLGTPSGCSRERHGTHIVARWQCC